MLLLAGPQGADISAGEGEGGIVHALHWVSFEFRIKITLEISFLDQRGARQAIQSKFNARIVLLIISRENSTAPTSLDFVTFNGEEQSGPRAEANGTQRRIGVSRAYRSYVPEWHFVGEQAYSAIGFADNLDY